jgi:hypothetical protein
MTLSSERPYDLDWLRVLGVLLLIAFHVALIFVLQPYTIVYIRDVVNSPVRSVTKGFIHMWHMPVLYMISGSATYFALGFGQQENIFVNVFCDYLFRSASYCQPMSHSRFMSRTAIIFLSKKAILASSVSTWHNWME